ncbi:alpha/beta fold hydrolase [Kocuria sabuli]|uniref:alpha/beta fold hydrolase n=1 Tax=Kocuria sabuli TaxID=3071448 RepID=UPI0034D5C674
MNLKEQFTWRGRRIAWSTKGSGPAVVFCHGTPWSSVLWAPFAEALAKDHTVYSWDMPGYGASSMDPTHDVDLVVQGEALLALLDHWALQNPHVIAHDYGGAVSLCAHLLHGAPFASLCLVDAVALRPWGSPFLIWSRTTPRSSPSYLKPCIEACSRRTSPERATTASAQKTWQNWPTHGAGR